VKAELPEQRIASADAPSCSRDTTGSAVSAAKDAKPTGSVSSRPVWPCPGMSRVIRTAGIRRGGGLSIACSLLHVRPSLTDAKLDWTLPHGELYGFPSHAEVSRPSRCRARIGSASSAPSHPIPRVRMSQPKSGQDNNKQQEGGERAFSPHQHSRRRNQPATHTHNNSSICLVQLKIARGNRACWGAQCRSGRIPAQFVRITLQFR
jgi:hypothetical protein